MACVRRAECVGGGQGRNVEVEGDEKEPEDRIQQKGENEAARDNEHARAQRKPGRSVNGRVDHFPHLNVF